LLSPPSSAAYFYKEKRIDYTRCQVEQSIDALLKMIRDENQDGEKSNEMMEHMRPIIWLCVTFLGTCLREGTLKTKMSDEKNIFDFVSYDDIGYIILNYENNYDIWKNMAEYKLKNGVKRTQIETEKDMDVHQSHLRGKKFGGNMTVWEPQSRLSALIDLLDDLFEENDKNKTMFAEAFLEAYRQATGKVQKRADRTTQTGSEAKRRKRARNYSKFADN
jgi:hypothetical protein